MKAFFVATVQQCHPLTCFINVVSSQLFIVEIDFARIRVSVFFATLV